MRWVREIGLVIIAAAGCLPVVAQTDGSQAPKNTGATSRSAGSTATPTISSAATSSPGSMGAQESASTAGTGSASGGTAAKAWDFNLSLSGYVVQSGQSYASPTLTADHTKLHLEARYNYEAQKTGSLWVGYNLNVGKKVVLDATPMIGGVFGNLNAVAPGLEFTVTYKKLQLYSANEYLFDTNTSAGNYFYTWTQLTYAPVQWFNVGYVTQRTRAYQTPLDVQRGPMVGFTYKKLNFTTTVFNVGEADPTTVFGLAYSF
jgi:hypothetical protein